MDRIGGTYSLWFPRGATGMQYQSYIVFARILDLPLALPFQAPDFLHIQTHVTVLRIAFNHGRIPFSGRKHRSRSLLASPLGHNNAGGIKIIEIKLNLLFFVCRVQRGGNGTLPANGQEKRDEFI